MPRTAGSSLGRHPWQSNNAMQQAATGPGEGRYVNVFPTLERMFAQNRIAVMAGIVNCILAVGVERPGVFSEKLKLGQDRPVGDFLLMALVFALHFLQEHQIGIGGYQCIPDLVQHKAPIGGTETFVDVIG